MCLPQQSRPLLRRFEIALRSQLLCRRDTFSFVRSFYLGESLIYTMPYLYRTAGIELQETSATFSPCLPYARCRVRFSLTLPFRRTTKAAGEVPTHQIPNIRLRVAGEGGATIIGCRKGGYWRGRHFCHVP